MGGAQPQAPPGELEPALRRLCYLNLTTRILPLLAGVTGCVFRNPSGYAELSVWRGIDTRRSVRRIDSSAGDLRGAVYRCNHRPYSRLAAILNQFLTGFLPRPGLTWLLASPDAADQMSLQVSPVRMFDYSWSVWRATLRDLEA